MTVLLTDGTLCGVFSALYHAFTFRLTDVKAAAGGTQLSFTDIALPIACDPIAAQRVQEAIVRYGGRRTLHECEIAMLSGEHDKHAVIFDYLKTLLSMRRDLKGMLALPEVLCFENLLKRIWCEAHRFEGFIRFSKTAGGTSRPAFAFT